RLDTAGGATVSGATLVTTSGATVLIVKGLLLCAQPLLGVPHSLMFHHGVEDCDQFTHTGDQGDLFGLACRTEARIERLQHRIMAHGRQGPHIERGTYRGAATPNGPRPTEGATIAVQGCDAYQRSNLLPAEGAELRQIQQQGPSTHGANAWRTAE